MLRHWFKSLPNFKVENAWCVCTDDQVSNARTGTKSTTSGNDQPRSFWIFLDLFGLWRDCRQNGTLCKKNSIHIQNLDSFRTVWPSWRPLKKKTVQSCSHCPNSHTTQQIPTASLHIWIAQKQNGRQESKLHHARCGEGFHDISFLPNDFDSMENLMQVKHPKIPNNVLLPWLAALMQPQSPSVCYDLL